MANAHIICGTAAEARALVERQGGVCAGPACSRAASRSRGTACEFDGVRVALCDPCAYSPRNIAWALGAAARADRADPAARVFAQVDALRTRSRELPETEAAERAVQVARERQDVRQPMVSEYGPGVEVVVR